MRSESEPYRHLTLRSGVRTENNMGALAEAALLSPPRAVNAHLESLTGVSLSIPQLTAPVELPLPGERRSEH